MRIIFVRHGQTVYNRESKYQGQMDAQLSELGLKQAELVAARLKHENISAVYSSDLSRARETAEQIAAYHNMKVNVETGLRECSFGAWEGLTVSSVMEKYPVLYSDYQSDSVRFRAPGGERLEELQERTVQTVEGIVSEHHKSTVLIVTHNGPIKAFLCHALDTGLETFRKIRLDNIGITIFSREPGRNWFLETLNDSCHTL